MVIDNIFVLIVAIFITEYIDIVLGMGFGALSVPVLLLAGFLPLPATPK